MMALRTPSRIAHALRERLGSPESIAHALGMRLGVLRQFAPRPVRSLRLPPPSGNLDGIPIIALVTPARNAVAYIDHTMRSVFDQQYPRLEYVVMDGGSTDGTAEIMMRYRTQLLHTYSGPDGGQAAAINAGFVHTSGEIMGWLNADDLLLPGALRFVGGYFRDHPEVDVIYGHRLLIDEHGHEIGRWVMPPHNEAAFRWVDFIPQETMFWRRSLWQRLDGLNANFRFAMDWDLILRMREAGACFARVPYYLGAFRVHSEQKTLAEGKTGRSEVEALRARSAKEPDWHRLRERSLRWYIVKHIMTNRYYRARGWA